jgi:uncharacterized membrane protein
MVEIFENIYNMYNSFALIITTLAFVFVLYLKIRNRNNKEDKVNYNAILGILLLIGAFILYGLSNLRSSRKKTLGLLDAISLV